MKSQVWLKLLALFWTTNFVLHFTWEVLQIPFYEGMAQAEHGAAVWQCTLTTLGDTGIALAAYFGAAFAERSLTWLHSLSIRPLLIYFLIGLLATVVLEFLATEVQHRWTYSELMPTLPLLKTGLIPLVQWIIIPALALGAVRLMYFGLRYTNMQQSKTASTANAHH